MDSVVCRRKLNCSPSSSHKNLNFMFKLRCVASGKTEEITAERLLSLTLARAGVNNDFTSALGTIIWNRIPRQQTAIWQDAKIVGESRKCVSHPLRRLWAASTLISSVPYASFLEISPPYARSTAEQTEKSVAFDLSSGGCLKVSLFLFPTYSRKWALKFRSAIENK